MGDIGVQKILHEPTADPEVGWCAWSLFEHKFYHTAVGRPEQVSRSKTALVPNRVLHGELVESLDTDVLQRIPGQGHFVNSRFDSRVKGTACGSASHALR
jgi:hypothetical protein